MDFLHENKTQFIDPFFTLRFSTNISQKWMGYHVDKQSVIFNRQSKATSIPWCTFASLDKLFEVCLDGWRP